VAGEHLFGYALGNRVATLERDMPLLEQFVREREREQPFAGVTAVLIQHQLGNQGPQIEAMVRLGLDPRRTIWLDIPYTSNERFRDVVGERHKIPSRNFRVSRYRVLDAYAEYQFRRTQEIVVQLLRNPPDKLLVLDDGAYFLEAASGFRAQLPNVAIVEQTTRGILKMEDSVALDRYARRYPVVNVAESTPKRELESPWIGSAVVLALTHQLEALKKRSPRFAVTPESPCLVLGYGAVGKQVARHLKSTAHVHVFDFKKERMDEAAADGFPTWERRGQAKLPEEQLIKFKLIVGCSGRASFGVGDRAFLDPHAVLASASSGSVELSRGDFIDLAASSSIDDIEVHHSGVDPRRIHQNLRMGLVDREVVFLNAGFPVNFDGRLNCVPSRYMQPTATLMVAGAMQALTATGRGLIDVDKPFCEGLTTSFLGTLNAAEREALGAVGYRTRAQ